MKKKIIFVISFLTLPFENGNDRFLEIASMLDENKYDIEFVYSNFSHINKRIREKREITLPYKFTPLTEPGYKKNICLKRFYSHYVFSKNVRKYLESQTVVDIIYCSIPSLSVGKQCSEYCEKNNIEFIIDIQDLWPEAFKLILNNKIINKLIYDPIKRIANRIYESADKIIGVSKTYLDRAESVNRNVKGISVFLGTNLDKVDRVKRLVRKPEEEFWITYVGTLGRSYNIEMVIEAVAKLNNEGYSRIKLICMGEGPKFNTLKKLASDKNANVLFTGKLPYNDMISYLKSSNLTVNPIFEGAAQSIINKVGDYAVVGKPVLNTQTCREYTDLIEKYKIGITCSNSINDIHDTILCFFNNPKICSEMGMNNRILAEKLFDRSKTYKQIVQYIYMENEGNIK